MDCQWVEDHLEAIFSDKLAAEENRRARQHIESCDACRNEVQALIAIDPMIKKYFRAQLLEATRAGDAPARGVRGFRWTLQAGAVALVAVVLVRLAAHSTDGSCRAARSCSNSSFSNRLRRCPVS